MEGGIFLLQDDGLVKMTEQPYDAEALLQRLLADYPDLLAGDRIDTVAPRHWLLVEREIGIPAEAGGSDQWALDHLFLDQDAVPTFVEVKRSSDTRIRREVVGQMLDYAANAVVYWPAERIRAQFEAACALHGDDPALALTEFLGPDLDPEQFWDQTGRNLQAGRIRLLFVADVIPPRLRRIVEFLNGQMNPAEVLAVEIRQFVGHSNGQELKTLVPQVIGQTEASRSRRASTPSVLPISSVDDFLEQVHEGDRATAIHIIELLTQNGYSLVALTSSSGYPNLRAELPGVKTAPIRLGSDTFWIDLGHRNPALAGQTVNQELRRLLAFAAPSQRSIPNLTKTSLFVQFAQLTSPDAPERLADIFGLIRDTLSTPAPGPSTE